jgi:hypothetical protein
MMSLAVIEVGAMERFTAAADFSAIVILLLLRYLTTESIWW